MTAAKEADLAGPGIGDYAELERVLPDDYEPRLSPKATMQALYGAKRLIEDRLCEELIGVIPDDPSKPYDVHKVIEPIVDDGDFMEVHAGWAKSIVVGFARMGGRTVGFVANNPGYVAGVLDVDSSRKGARFVRFCDAFNIPIVTLVDVPGYLPGTGQEYGGVVTPFDDREVLRGALRSAGSRS